MSEVAGKDYAIFISGALIPFTGEATTSTGDLAYQITDPAKQVFDRTAPISVHLFTGTDTTEAGTNTTNIKMTAHGLATGDLICNTSRSNAYRIVTKVDNDNVTVSSVTGQTTGMKFRFTKQNCSQHILLIA